MKPNINESIYTFPIEKRSGKALENAMKRFVNQPLTYRTQFLQATYKTAFDGYSYLGQEDSLNQYSDDLLHSFVLSEFTTVERLPEEFKTFMVSEFKTVSVILKQLEIELLKRNGLEELATVYDAHFGHMISCNYYPEITSGEVYNKRLSAHKDVSLFSLFPYGLAEGLVYKTDQLVRLGEQVEAFGFKGYGLEYFTNGAFKALEHYVEMPKEKITERFSAAFFSIPKPNTTFTLQGKTYHSETFYQDYLNLF